MLLFIFNEYIYKYFLIDHVLNDAIVSSLGCFEVFDRKVIFLTPFAIV